MREGARGCTIGVDFGGCTITRRRGENVNEYFLDDQVFRAFGNEVPEPIKNFINIDPVLNFQNQHDAPYWFSETAGQVSRNLNGIVDLNLIDEALTKVNRTCNRAKGDLDIIEVRLAEASEKKRNLEWVVEADDELLRVEILEENLSKTNEKEALIKAKNDSILNSSVLKSQEEFKIEQLTKMMSQAESHIKLGRRVETLKKNIDLIQKNSGIEVPDTSNLKLLFQYHQAKEEKRNNLNSLCCKIRNESQNLIIPDLNLDSLVDQHRTLKYKDEELSKLIRFGQAGMKEKQNAEDSAKLLEEEILEKSEGICPICGSSFESIQSLV